MAALEYMTWHAKCDHMGKIEKITMKQDETQRDWEEQSEANNTEPDAECSVVIEQVTMDTDYKCRSSAFYLRAPDWIKAQLRYTISNYNPLNAKTDKMSHITDQFPLIWFNFGDISASSCSIDFVHITPDTKSAQYNYSSEILLNKWYYI